MAYNVFGTPITDQTLKGMPEYAGKVITRVDRAKVAGDMKNSGEKDVNARKFVENLKAQWGTGVSTLCVVYNATGDTVTLATNKDWYGHIGPSPYPVEIANGQWGAFLHVKTSGAASGSVAAVVYGGRNGAGERCDWMLAWSNPWNRWGYDNKAYTEIREGGHYNNGSVWGTVYNKLNNSGLHFKDEWKGCVSTATTGSSTSPIYEGIMTLKIPA